MGLFSNVNAGGAAPAYDSSRMESVLQSLDINFGRDDEGDLFGDWDSFRSWFIASGEDHEIMEMRALWDVRPPADAHDRVALACNGWNASHRWPRAYTFAADDECLVFADLSVDLETGASDDFLRQQVRCMLSTTFELFETLAEDLPEHKSWRNAAEPPPES